MCELQLIYSQFESRFHIYIYTMRGAIYIYILDSEPYRPFGNLCIKFCIV